MISHVIVGLLMSNIMPYSSSILICVCLSLQGYAIDIKGVTSEDTKAYDQDSDFKVNSVKDTIEAVEVSSYQACPTHKRKLRDIFCTTCSKDVVPVEETRASLTLLQEDGTLVDKTAFTTALRHLLDKHSVQEAEDLEGLEDNFVLRGDVIVYTI